MTEELLNRTTDRRPSGLTGGCALASLARSVNDNNSMHTESSQSARIGTPAQQPLERGYNMNEHASFRYSRILEASLALALLSLSPWRAGAQVPVANIETPTAVYFDEISSSAITASAYVSSGFTGLSTGQSGTAV